MHSRPTQPHGEALQYPVKGRANDSAKLLRHQFFTALLRRESLGNFGVFGSLRRECE